MSYELCDGSHYRLTQTRDAIRLLKRTSQEAEPGTVIETELLASYLTLIDEQLTSIITEGIRRSALYREDARRV